MLTEVNLDAGKLVLLKPLPLLSIHGVSDPYLDQQQTIRPGSE
jgi:hypothetical protein